MNIMNRFSFWKKFFSIYLVIFSGVIIYGCSQKNIIINEQAIPRSFVRYKALLQEEMHQINSGQKPGQSSLENAEKVVIQETLLVQYAERIGQKSDKKRITEIFRDLKNRYQSEKEFKNDLEKKDITESDIKMEIENHLLLESLKNNIIDGIEVDKEEIENFYSTHRKEYLKPASYHYFVIVTEKEGEAKKAEKAYENSRDFSKVAQEYSIAKSGDNGGDEGKLTENELLPPLKKILDEMKPGDVSSFIKTDFGYIKVKLISKSEGQLRPLSEVEADIIRRIKNEKYKMEREKLLKKLIKKADISGLQISKESLLSDER